MIYYFSGEGNTRYCAKKISKFTGEKLVFIPEADASKETFEGKSLGIMFPVYSWGVPPLVLDFINRLSDSFIGQLRKEKAPVWMVCTCGDETGLAPEMLEKALHNRGLSLQGTWSVIMPDTYVLLPGFNVDSAKVEEAKLDSAPGRVDAIARKINSGEWESDIHYGPMPGLKTKIVYPLFKKWGINRKKWHWTEECIQCGRCAEKCPVGNIEMKGGHPRWHDRCVSCLACYHNCPVHAVAYGRATNNKGQYLCPLR